MRMLPKSALFLFRDFRHSVLEDSEMTGKGVRALLACRPGRAARSASTFPATRSATKDSRRSEGFRFRRSKGCACTAARLARTVLAAFARSATTPKLRELDLGGPDVTVHGGGGNALRAAGAKAMAGASFRGQLEVLLLSGNDIANEGAIALARVSMPIRRLDLTGQYDRCAGCRCAGQGTLAPTRVAPHQRRQSPGPSRRVEADVYQFAELPREMTSRAVGQGALRLLLAT